MPSKIQLDENLWFLYICLQNSDLKAIDFAAVAEHTNLKAPAARMRYTRLKRQIESGALIGTSGTPFTEKKRGGKRKSSSDGDVEGSDSEVDVDEKSPAKRKRVNSAFARNEKQDNTMGGRQGSRGTIFYTNNQAQAQPPKAVTQPFHPFNPAAFSDNARLQVPTQVKPTTPPAKPLSPLKQPNATLQSSNEQVNKTAEEDSNSEDEIPLAKLHKKHSQLPRHSNSPSNQQLQAPAHIMRGRGRQLIPHMGRGVPAFRGHNAFTVPFHTPHGLLQRGTGTYPSFMGRGRGAPRFFPGMHGMPLQTGGSSIWGGMSRMDGSARSFAPGVGIGRGGWNNGYQRFGMPQLQKKEEKEQEDFSPVSEKPALSV